jgi:hypothetical protein
VGQKYSFVGSVTARGGTSSPFFVRSSKKGRLFAFGRGHADPGTRRQYSDRRATANGATRARELWHAVVAFPDNPGGHPSPRRSTMFGAGRGQGKYAKRQGRG